MKVTGGKVSATDKAHLLFQMALTIEVPSTKAKLTVRASSTLSLLKNPRFSIKAFGRTTISMATEKNITIRTNQFTRVPLVTAKNVDLELKNGLMAPHTLANGQTT